ncbi:hypothetical protein SAY87_000219 [Trapa incisa]|uniref:RRM domain-containing protein n=1 Tax=Trapa incisa TaxID=236973 RepID=A0AAN7GLX3_9MYRT|nr:hypothetical protein SAY87_000219 [Trapa incisa]
MTRYTINGLLCHITAFHCKFPRSPFMLKGASHGKLICLKTASAAGIQGVEIGTKLYVSNLSYGVTSDDIRELFSEIGDIKRYAVHFDKTGRPTVSTFLSVLDIFL